MRSAPYGRRYRQSSGALHGSRRTWVDRYFPGQRGVKIGVCKPDEPMSRRLSWSGATGWRKGCDLTYAAGAVPRASLQSRSPCPLSILRAMDKDSIIIVIINRPMLAPIMFSERFGRIEIRP